MHLVRHVYLIIFLVGVSACGQKGIYSQGYYSGRGNSWPRGIHVVKPGETLYSIAWQYGHDYREMARWNGISRPYTIYPQQELKIERPPAQAVETTKNVTKVHKNGAVRVKDKKGRRPVSRQRKLRHTSQKLVWQWPAKGQVVERFSPRDPGSKGIDIAGRTGQPIYAAERGYVVYSGSGLRGYGKLIIVKHNETFLSAYAHNEKLRVREGQKVKKGEHIADMGKTGTTTVQLHFEIRRNGVPVNPFKFLPKQ